MSIVTAAHHTLLHSSSKYSIRGIVVQFPLTLHNHPIHIRILMILMPHKKDYRILRDIMNHNSGS